MIDIEKDISDVDAQGFQVFDRPERRFGDGCGSGLDGGRPVFRGVARPGGRGCIG
jgi:hypothetical protein